MVLRPDKDQRGLGGRNAAQVQAWAFSTRGETSSQPARLSQGSAQGRLGERPGPGNPATPAVPNLEAEAAIREERH